MRAIQSIRNIGPKMEIWFQKAGFQSAEEIEAAGLDRAYARLLEAGMQPHFMAYLALDAGLKAQHYNFHSETEKQALRLRHDDIAKKNRPEDGFEAIMNVMGLIDPARSDEEPEGN